MATLLPCSDTPDEPVRCIVGDSKGFTLQRLCEILDPNCKGVRFIENPNGSPGGYFAVVDRDAELIGLGINDLFAMSSGNHCIVRGPVVLVPGSLLLCDPVPKFNFHDPLAPTFAPLPTRPPEQQQTASVSMAAVDFALSWFEQGDQEATTSTDHSASLNYSRY